MSIFNSISVSVLIVLLVAGVLIGVSVSGTDILNPNTSAAEANRMNIEVAHQQAVYQLQERLATANTEAEIKQIQRQQEMLEVQFAYDQQILAQNLVNRQHLNEAGVTLLVWFGGALGISVILYALILSVPKAIAITKSISSQPKVQVAANENTQKASKDYNQEYIDLVHENRNLKRRNEHLITVNRNLANFCQALAKEREEIAKEAFDIEEFVRNMKLHRDPAKKMKGDYKDNPLAGD